MFISRHKAIQSLRRPVDVPGTLRSLAIGAGVLICDLVRHANHDPRSGLAWALLGSVFSYRSSTLIDELPNSSTSRANPSMSPARSTVGLAQDSRNWRAQLPRLNFTDGFRNN